MKLYHYTHPSKCVEVLHGESQELSLNSLVGRLKCNEIYGAFTLLEPQPDNWINNSDFPDFWSRLKSHMGQILLEININPESDKVIVLDRGHLVKFNSSLPGGSISSNVPQQYAHETREKAEEAYVGSRVLLMKYLQESETFQYALPEAVITKPVPSKRIVVSQTQPLLEEELLTDGVTIGDEPPKEQPIEERIRIAGYYVRRIPELDSWFVEYKERIKTER